jgi:hypothetical protein
VILSRFICSFANGGKSNDEDLFIKLGSALIVEMKGGKSSIILWLSKKPYSPSGAEMELRFTGISSVMGFRLSTSLRR